MICFGAKTDQEEENVICGSHIKKKKKKNNKKKRKSDGHSRSFDFFFLYFSLSSLFNIRKSDLQNSSGQEAKCSTQQGLHLGTKNTGFRRVFN